MNTASKESLKLNPVKKQLLGKNWIKILSWGFLVHVKEYTPTQWILYMTGGIYDIDSAKSVDLSPCGNKIEWTTIAENPARFVCSIEFQCIPVITLTLCASLSEILHDSCSMSRFIYEVILKQTKWIIECKYCVAGIQ